MIDRLRYRRNIQRWSQYELAEELGVTRSALASYESGRVPLPFAVGLALCKRLDLNPRWVVEGQGMEVPFVELSELQLAEADILPAASGLSFDRGYELFLKGALEIWSQIHPVDELVLLRMRGGVESWARQASLLDLEERRREALEAHKKGQNGLSDGHLAIVKAIERELESRRAGKTRNQRSGRKNSLVENKVLTKDKPSPYITPNVKGPLLSHWIARANALVSHRGGKVALARHLGVTPQSIHGFLTGASAPSAENILRLQAWVIETEANKKGSEGGGTPSDPETQNQRKITNEPSETSPP